MKGEAKFFASLKETSEKRHKKPSAKPRTKGRWPKGKAHRVPRVKVLNYLKTFALLFRFERDILADGAQVMSVIISFGCKGTKSLSHIIEKQQNVLIYEIIVIYLQPKCRNNQFMISYACRLHIL